MLSEIIFALLGAVFGVLLTAAPALRRRFLAWTDRRALAKRRDLTANHAVDRWLLNHYRRTGTALFEASIGRARVLVPVLTQERWNVPRKISMKDDWPVAQRATPDVPPIVDRTLIHTRRRQGTNLYETVQRSLYLDAMEPDGLVDIADEQNVRAVLATRPCRYYAIATSMIKLEDETFAAARGSPRGRLRAPFRNEHLSGSWEPGVPQRRPFSVGGLVVFAVRARDSYEIAVQTRSDEVLAQPGSRAVIPNFGLTENVLGGVRSVYGVLTYNFIKEYLEEMHDYEELIGKVMRRHVNPDWFMEFPEAKELLRLYDSRLLTLTYLGTGVECLNGVTALSLLVTIDDPEFSDRLRRDLVANWEVALPASDVGGVQFVDMYDPLLAKWLEAGDYQPTSAFALSLALAELRRLRSSASTPSATPPGKAHEPDP